MVVSQIGRPQGRVPAEVAAWLRVAVADDLFLSVLSIGEIRRGIELLRPRDPSGSASIDARLRTLLESFGPRVLPVDSEVADRWGWLRARPAPPPPVDGLIAATALVHDLALVTRNARHFEGLGLELIDPWHPTDGRSPRSN